MPLSIAGSDRRGFGDGTTRHGAVAVSAASADPRLAEAATAETEG